MSPFIRYIAATVFFLGISTVARADDLRCGEDIISPGATEQQVLDACGQPASVDGSVWAYEFAGSLPRKLTFGNGVLMFVEAGEEAGLADKPGPFGEHP